LICFIGSVGYSGSTMLDTMLGNGEKCFSCGEVYALFWPWKKHHKTDNSFWMEIKKEGIDNLYKNIYRMGYDFISDSSKSLKWYKYQLKNIEDQEFSCKQILLFKHPHNYMYSRYKRGRANHIHYLSWYVYYKQFLNLFNDAIIISYEELAKNPSKTLKKLCYLLEIEYFKGKEYFWEGSLTHLFGARSVRLQFYDPDSNIYKKQKNIRNNIIKIENVVKHRTIYYDDIWKEKLPKIYKYTPWFVNNLYNYLNENKI